ncbi:hypothetical protein FBUS_01357 [Fasciolopsis buskii]|uniref:Uncharacterized protein n=1 Tax=Fasciolopsis buskii TaxID=27845 RepID=A0A8E0RMR6_9TREM|nr:hypothetical protein FBUS_01357 [Fasciolopsis buski]
MNFVEDSFVLKFIVEIILGPLVAYNRDRSESELFSGNKSSSCSSLFSNFISLDKTGNVLYFQVSATTGTTAEAVAQALREGKGNFEGFLVEQVGFGRGTPLLLSVAEAVPPKKYTVTLVVCLSIISFLVVLFLAYCIQLCRRKFQIRHNRDTSQKDALIEVERHADRQNRFPAILKSIHETFEKNLHPEKMKATKPASSPITKDYQLPTEETFNQPPLNSSGHRYSKDTMVTEVSGLSEQRRKCPVEHKDSLTSQGSGSQSW